MGPITAFLLILMSMSCTIDSVYNYRFAWRTPRKVVAFSGVARVSEIHRLFDRGQEFPFFCLIRTHACPTEFVTAPCCFTGHMVAATVLFDVCVALRTLFCSLRDFGLR